MASSIRQLVNELDSMVEELPNLDRDDLESRISDIQSDVERLAQRAEGYVGDEFTTGLASIFDALGDLYNEI